jgi:hypothetical protein
MSLTKRIFFFFLQKSTLDGPAVNNCIWGIFIMDIKSLTKIDRPQWNDMVANELSHFPIYIQRSKWQKGTSYHFQPGIEIHMTQEGTGILVIDRQILLQSPRKWLYFAARSHTSSFQIHSIKGQSSVLTWMMPFLNNCPNYLRFLTFPGFPKILTAVFRSTP